MFIYAKRVRVLNLQQGPNKSSSTPSVSPQTYIFIATELEGRPLFPALQKIIMQTAPDLTDEFAPIPLIFTSSVQDVTFQGQDLSNGLSVHYCLPLVGERLASLRRLALSSNEEDIEASTFDAILQLTNLESLDIQLPQAKDPIPEFLAKAGRALKKLSSLTIDLHFSSHEVPTVDVLLAKWKTCPPSQSTLRILAIRDHRNPLSFTNREYNDIAQLLDLMFPSLVSIKPYCEADEDKPYWKDHWWFIEHLRLSTVHVLPLAFF
ncbi:hypothetical protein H1R20_g3418, partial [Candolleomyces eurysporus]